jgi:glutaredoxin 3
MIEIYTSRHCPYCQSAKRLLVGKAVQFREIDIAANAEKLEEMVSRSGGQSTVPQIFINGQHIGDNRSLAKLNLTGQLDRMLNPSSSMTP